MRLKLIISIFFTVFLTSNTQADEISKIVEVKNPWIKYNPMQGRSSAAYMDIQNLGGDALKLIAVKVAAPAHAMVHKTVTTDGVSKMQHTNEVLIKAGSTTSFKPRGLHIMLMNMPTGLELGSTVVLSLEFLDGKTIDVNYKLCSLASASIC